MRLPPGRAGLPPQPPCTTGSEEDGTLSIWGGAFSGFTIEADYDAAVYLRHRCGWATEIAAGGERDYFAILGNVVFGPMLDHLNEGCSP